MISMIEKTKKFAYLYLDQNNKSVVNYIKRLPANFDPSTIAHKFTIIPVVDAPDAPYDEAFEELEVVGEIIGKEYVIQKKPRPKTPEELEDYNYDLSAYIKQVGFSKALKIDPEWNDSNWQYKQLTALMRAVVGIEKKGNSSATSKNILDIESLIIVAEKIEKIIAASKVIDADPLVNTKDKVDTDPRWDA